MDKKRYRSWDEILKAECVTTPGKRLSPLEKELLRIKASIQENEKKEQMEKTEEKVSAHDVLGKAVPGDEGTSEGERKAHRTGKDTIVTEHDDIEKVVDPRTIPSAEKTLADFDRKSPHDAEEDGSRSRDMADKNVDGGHSTPSSRESILSILEEGQNVEIEKMKKKRAKEQMSSLLDEYVDWK